MGPRPWSKYAKLAVAGVALLATLAATAVALWYFGTTGVTKGYHVTQDSKGRYHFPPIDYKDIPGNVPGMDDVRVWCSHAPMVLEDGFTGVRVTGIPVATHLGKREVIFLSLGRSDAGPSRPGWCVDDEGEYVTPAAVAAAVEADLALRSPYGPEWSLVSAHPGVMVKCCVGEDPAVECQLLPP